MRRFGRTKGSLVLTVYLGVLNMIIGCLFTISWFIGYVKFVKAPIQWPRSNSLSLSWKNKERKITYFASFGRNVHIEMCIVVLHIGAKRRKK